MKRVLIAEDHNLVREAFINMLEKDGRYNVVKEIDDGTELLKYYRETEPDIVLLDIEMPGKSGPDAARELLKEDSTAKILFLTQYEDEEFVYMAYSIGSAGLITKTCLKEELFNAIDSILNGGSYFAPYTEEELAEMEFTSDTKKLGEISFDPELLSEREREIIYLIGKGYSSDKIAENLFISKRTVDYHRQNIIKKLKIGTFPELILKASEYINTVNNGKAGY